MNWGSMHRQSKGLTLIELIIVVAIVGILSAVAYPSYTEYVKKTHRAEITGLLLETAQHLERFYSRNGQYSDVVGPPAVTLEVSAGNAFYAVVADRTNGQAFTLTATPIGTAMMKGDKCGSFVIDNTGKRDNLNMAGEAIALLCWSR